ncbi:unnamed protein product [Heterobilharzia americana]|nr:unnamed protein product [Heterobilharzia americana]
MNMWNLQYYCIGLSSFILLSSMHLCSGYYRRGVDEAFYDSKKSMGFASEAIYGDKYQYGGSESFVQYGGDGYNEYGGYDGGYDYDSDRYSGLAYSSVNKLKELHGEGYDYSYYPPRGGYDYSDSYEDQSGGYTDA